MKSMGCLILSKKLNDNPNRMNQISKVRLSDSVDSKLSNNKIPRNFFWVFVSKLNLGSKILI